MVLLENEQFLSELTKFYQKIKTAGTVLVAMKRYDGRTKPVPRAQKKSQPNPPEPQEYSCLFRAQLGSKKISTVVTHHAMNKFQVAYSNLIRGNIELKKKDKKTEQKSNKKNKSSAAASSSATNVGSSSK
jgi:signal recognition particle subunit SRP14